MPISVYEDVLGLQVSICDAFAFMQELEYEDDFGSVKLRGGFVEAAGSSEIAKDFAARAVVELEQSRVSDVIRVGKQAGQTYYHVEGVERLEASDHGGDEGVSRDFGEDVALVADVFDLLETDD